MKADGEADGDFGGDFDGLRPEIHYPCTWSYRIVCGDAAAVRAGVPAIVGAAAHRLVDVRSSRGGRYHTLELELEVADEAERDRIFEALGRLPSVRMLL